MRIHYSNQKKGKVKYSGTVDQLENKIIHLDFWIYDTKEVTKEDFIKLIEQIFKNNERK